MTLKRYFRSFLHACQLVITMGWFTGVRERGYTNNSDMFIVSVLLTRSPYKSIVPQINLEPISSTNKPINYLAELKQ